MSNYIQGAPIPNWQENAAMRSPVYQQMPLTPSKYSPCYPYPNAPAHMMAPPQLSQPQQYAMRHGNQMMEASDYFSPNKSPAMVMNFPRYQQPPMLNQSPSPMKSGAMNPPKRQRSLEDESSDSGGEPKAGVKGIHIDSDFYDLQHFAYDGCTFAESIAQSYRKRPCFKKIDLLLSRLKNDLNVYHNIEANVNSQGTAWAIKDFTFAYSRIINAWIILRDYVYDQSEGLDTLRSDFDQDYIDNFSEWQSATLKMLKSLMRSVENLNISAQYKSGGGDGMRRESLFRNGEGNDYSKEFLESFQKTLFTPKCAPNSEEIQIRNHHSRAYYRAGVLKPLMIDNSHLGFQTPSPGSAYNSAATPSSANADEFNWWGPIDESPLMISGMSERLYNRGKSSSLPTTPIEAQSNPFDFSTNTTAGTRAKKTLIEKFNAVNFSD